MTIRVAIISVAALAMSLAAFGCSGLRDDCSRNPNIDCPGGSGGSSGTLGGGGSGSGSTGSTGGNAPCDGACSGDAPICDVQADTCVGCLDNSHCTNVEASRCGDDNTCQPCIDNDHCGDMGDAALCDSGTCVQCSLTDSSACSGEQTCNLLEGACTDVAPGALSNCETCSNDTQCEDGHRCVAMTFQDAPHGFYCLEVAGPGCDNPFLVAINASSINGEPAEDYCGIDQGQTTCEAVRALLGDWRCSGNDGMCSPPGLNEPEVEVPGAICRQVGLANNRCTYPCGSTIECLSTGPAQFCGDGTSTPPGWCGG